MRARCPRLTAAIILSGSALQVKGLPLARSFGERRSEHQLRCGRYGLTMQSAPCGACDLISPGEDLRSGITPTMLYYEITKRGFEVQSRIACKNFFE